MRTEEEAVLKDKIINLLGLAKTYIYMSSGLNPEFYNDLDIKKAMINAFDRVEDIKIIIDGDANKRKNEVGWLFEEGAKLKSKMRIRNYKDGISHWLIIDGKHFRLEKPHEKEVMGINNLLVYDISPPIMSKILIRMFTDWWSESSPINL